MTNSVSSNSNYVPAEQPPVPPPIENTTNQDYNDTDYDQRDLSTALQGNPPTTNLYALNNTDNTSTLGNQDTGAKIETAITAQNSEARVRNQTGNTNPQTADISTSTPNGSTLIASADSKTPLQQAAEISSTINSLSGYAGALHTALDKSLNLGQKLQNTQQGVESALKQRANVAVGRELIARHYDNTINQINRLLSNPIVQKDARVVSNLKRDLQIATAAKAAELKPFNATLSRLDNFLIANGSKLSSVSKQAKVFGAIGDSLNVVGAGTNGFSAYANSPTTTQAGKIVDGILAGAVNYGFGKGLPNISAVDAVTGQNISNSLNGVVATAVTVTEATLTGDTTGLRNLEQKTRNGDYGAFLQAGNAAGNALASLENASTREQYVQDAANGRYGWVGQFGNALGEGLFNIYSGLGGK